MSTAATDPPSARLDAEAPATSPRRKPVSPEEREARRLAERESLLTAIGAQDFDTLHKRVAWVLNHFPASRDSDIALQIAYWETFEPDYSGDTVHAADLYRFTRLTSLARARAAIQNKYQLFLASPQVRKRRGKLSEEERVRFIEQEPPYPAWVVYADESGKQSRRYVVGSLWFLHPPTLIAVQKAMRGFRNATGYDAEFKFSSITANNLGLYCDLIDLLASHREVMGFKAVSIPRAGLRVDDAIARLFYHLLVGGIEHENATGRAPLPRSLILVKDAEEFGRDQMLLADLDDRLKQAASTRFEGKFKVDRLARGISSEDELLQLADLYAGSLNRLLESEQPARQSAKDAFADHFFQTFGVSAKATATSGDGDAAIHLIL